MANDTRHTQQQLTEAAAVLSDLLNHTNLLTDCAECRALYRRAMWALTREPEYAPSDRRELPTPRKDTP